MIAVDEFVQDEVALWVVAQVRRLDQFFEVPPMVVQVPGHPQFPLGREVDDLLLA
jgi:hypothetical protein